MGEHRELELRRGAWRSFTITLRVRGTIGQRRTATRRFAVYAYTYEDAMMRAQERALESIAIEVKAGDLS